MKSITEIKEALERLHGEAFLQSEMTAKEEMVINLDIATLAESIEELKGLRELRKTNDELRQVNEELRLDHEALGRDSAQSLRLAETLSDGYSDAQEANLFLRYLIAEIAIDVSYNDGISTISANLYPWIFEAIRTLPFDHTKMLKYGTPVYWLSNLRSDLLSRLTVEELKQLPK